MNLYEQIKHRRRQLRLTQHDMRSRIGMSRQQYQRLEAHGNPRLENLLLVAEGLNAELMLVPREKAQAVRRLLEDTTGADTSHETPPPDVDPWHGLLGDTDDTTGQER